MPPQIFHNEGARLRKLASNAGVSYKWREHALAEMVKDDINKTEIINLLKRCKVVRVEQNRFEETWNAEGCDVDGNPIVVVLVVYEEHMTIKVVTAWRP